MRQLLCLLLAMLLLLETRAQAPVYVKAATAEAIPWAQFEPADKRFYIAGEAHLVSVNTVFQLSHLQYLVGTGVRNLVFEYPYSYGVIANAWLATGNDSLARFFLGGSVQAYEYWKSVYELNRSLPDGDKIRVWGIDLELNDRWRADLFRKAILLLTAGKPPAPPALATELATLRTLRDVADVTASKNRLKALLSDPQNATWLGSELRDVRIMVNRLDHFEANRNDEMLDALNEIIREHQLPSDARFLGQFGWGHISKTNRGSISWLLENHPRSPVRGSTFVCGVQYLNCRSTPPQKGLDIENGGVVAKAARRRELASLDTSDPSPIRVMLRDVQAKPWTPEADVVLVFSGFGPVEWLRMAK